VAVDDHLRAGERLWAIGDVNGAWPLTHVGKYEGEVVEANILGEGRTVNYEAVPRVTYTDPQAGAVRVNEAPFAGTARLTEIGKTASYTHAYKESKGYLTLLSDGEVLTGAPCPRAGGGGVAPAGDPGDQRPDPPRRPRRHDPALPDLLRDLRGRAERAARRGGRVRSRRPALIIAAALAAALLLCQMPASAAAAGPLVRPVPRILSASWGTDGAVGCPNGVQGLDNIPVTFNWFIRRASIQPRDFRIVRSDGSLATPTCALQFPPDERDEAQTVNLIGDLYDHETSFNADNMHDLCLPPVPRGAKLAGVTIAAGLIQDPDGDPNLAQDFAVRPLGS
jgi:hypothetical protein